MSTSKHVFTVCRYRSDRCLLRMPVCRLCTHHRATTTPPKHRHHPAHCENDCGGECRSKTLLHATMEMLLKCTRLCLGEPVGLHDDHAVHIQTLKVEGGVSRSGHQDVAARFRHRWVSQKSGGSFI